jgi:hypothetical protein
MAKIDTIKEFAEIGFMRLERATVDLKESQLDWKSCPQANTPRWILTHLNNQFFGFIPRIVKGDKKLPSELPEDYVGNPDLSIQKIMEDLKKGKDKLMKTLDSLKDEDIDQEMDWFYGKRTKGFYLILALSEIIHHEGQLAAILGVEKRMKET